MDSYRPRERDNDSDDGFQIRGAASRQHHDADRPARRERDDRYYSHNDNYQRPRYGTSSSETYYNNSSNGYSDVHSMYDEPEQPPANTGEEDVSTTGDAIQFLIIRDLKLNVDEEKLSKGLEKLNMDDDELSTAQQLNMMPTVPGAPLPPPPGAPSQPLVGAEPSSLKRVFLIRDRLTDKSMQYGFAEYHDVKNARAAYNKANKLGEKCTIASKKISVDFPHIGVFKPLHAIGQRDKDDQFGFDMRGESWAYRDFRYYASPLIINAEPPARPKSPTPPNAAPTKAGKKRSNDLDDAGALSKQTGIKIKKTKLGPNFDMWQKKQGELRGETVNAHDDPTNGSAGDSGAEQEVDHGTSFIVPGDKIGKAANIRVCLLCGTALGESVKPEDHAHKSEKHLANLKGQDIVKRASERLAKYNLSEDDYIRLRWGKDSGSEEKAQTQTQYRDRAKERRQDEVKSGIKIKMSLKPTVKDKNTKTSAGQNPTAPLSGATSTPTYGMGMKMLQKAGWSEGQGLGSGSGISAPIEQSMYAAGVGLGHEGSKKGDAVEEALRMTKNEPGSFLEKTREGARERFNRME